MNPSRPTVLCVDDDPDLLAGLVTTLRSRFTVTTAESGAEALAKLADLPRVQVIVSDLAMPGMTGPEFLARSRALAPHAVRLLLTGHASVEGAVAAVNQGVIFRFLLKPCPPEELIAAVEAAVVEATRGDGERARLQRQADEVFSRLVEAERRATLGTMAGAIGGEISNVIVAFDMALDLVSERSGGGRPPGAEELAILRRVRDHMATHGRSLRDLGGAEREALETCDLCEVAGATVNMLRFSGVLRHAKVQVGIPESAVCVPLPRTRVEQVLINLLKNAVEAIEEVPGRTQRVFVSVYRDPDGKTVHCTVEDNGCGIPKERRGDIYEPYVTSKPRRRAAGLGLFVVKLLVESRQGQVGFTTREGRGSNFFFRLPIVSPAFPVA